MEQEVKVTVELTLTLPVYKGKEQIQNGVEMALNYLRTNLNSPLVHQLSRYVDGDIFTKQSEQAKVIDIKDESEIYKHIP